LTVLKVLNIFVITVVSNFSDRNDKLLQIVFQLIENCDVSHLEDEPSPHVIRVGWSAGHTSMQLGKIFYVFAFIIKVSHQALFSFAG
jgi:hypothetical protein